jgi:hypothetical protein
MTTATQGAALTAEQRSALIDALTRELLASQTPAAAGTRDVGPGGEADGGAAVPAAPAAAPTGVEAQRFFGSLISVLGPPLVKWGMNWLSSRRRELGIPDQRDAASVERDFMSLFQSILTTLPQALPGIIQAFQGHRDLPAPRDADEAVQRFFPALLALLPAVIPAVTSIIDMFNKQRGVDAPPAIDDRDFLSALGSVFSTIGPMIPQIIQAFAGGGRDLPAPRTW